ncbi:MAG: ATP-binding protein [Roseiflexus sp.]
MIMNNPSVSSSINLSIPGEPGYERVVREAVASFALRLGFATERVEDLKTAVSEACLNAMEYGNAQAPGLRVDVQCVWDGSGLTVCVQDQGLRLYSGYVMSCVEQRLGGDAPTRNLGLYLITQLVDACGFEPSPGGGNVLYMCMRRCPRA